MAETMRLVSIAEVAAGMTSEVAAETSLEVLQERLRVQSALLEGVLLDLRQGQEKGSDLDARTTALVTAKKSIRIRSQATYEEACDGLRMVKELAAEIKRMFGGLRAKTNEAHKLAKVHEDFYLVPLAKAEAELKAKIAEYEREANRKWQARQAELDAAAKAEAIETGEPNELVMARPTLQKVAGISMTEVWSCVVDDEAALRQAVYAGAVPADVLVVDLAALNRYARAMKETLPFPGCRAVRGSSVRAVVR